MRVVSVPGRTIRNPATGRVIDDVGIEVSSHDVTFHTLVAHGDLAIVPEAAPTKASKEAAQ